MGRATGIAGGFSQSLTVAYNRFATLPFLFVLIAIQVYLYINGASHFENWSELTYDGKSIETYILMTVIFLFWAGKRTKWVMQQPMEKSAYAFGLFFIVTLAIMSALVYSGFIGVDKTGCPYEIFWPTVLLQITCVATAEELMFRGVLLEVTHSNIIQALCFSFWHAAAYGVLWYNIGSAGIDEWIVPLIWAFGIGLILGFIAMKKEYGLPATIAVHSCVNLVIVGCLIL